MSKGLVNETTLNNLGNAINVLNGTSGTYHPSEMAAEILDVIPDVTVEGNPIHITDAAAYPAEECVVTLTPKQAGTGDPAPNNVRPITGYTGVEFNNASASDDIYTTENTDIAQGGGSIEILSNSSLRLYGTAPYTASKQLLSNYNLTNGKTYIVTAHAEIASGVAFIAIRNVTNNKVIDSCEQTTQSRDLALKFTYNSSVTSFLSFFANYELSQGDVTYTNIKFYDASNTYSVTFPALGKNLFDNTKGLNPTFIEDLKNALNAYKQYGYYAQGYISNGTQISSNANYLMSFTKCSPNVTYTISGSEFASVLFLDDVGNIISRSGTWIQVPFTHTTSSNEKYIAASFARTNINNVQLELGSTATSYEPFNNTVYGCEVDWVNGVLRVTDVNVDLGSFTWTYDSTGEYFKTQIDNTQRTGYLCSCYLFTLWTSPASQLINAQDKNGYYQSSNNNIFIKDNSYNGNTTDFKNAMDGVQFVYELATPIEIPLTPEVITLLKGENNIWTDSGTSEIMYKVDLNSYIQKLIDEASARANT